MLARCSVLERLPIAHSTSSSYTLLRIGGVRHYAIRSKDKRKAIREARLPKEPDYPPGHDPHGETSFEYISSWDLHADGLSLVRIPEDPLLYSQGQRPRNRWPTISTLDPNLLSPSDFVNISNLSKPKIICFDGQRMTSSVIEYGRRDISSSSSSTSTIDPPAKGPTSKWFGSASKTAPFKGLYANTETPRPSLSSSTSKPVRQHPVSDEDYVDSLLSAELPPTRAEPFNVPSPSSSNLASSSTTTAPRRLRNNGYYPPCTLVQGREAGRAEPELLDPSYETYLAQDQRHTELSENACPKSTAKEEEEGKVEGTGSVSVVHTHAQTKGKDKGRGDQPNYKLIPFPPGTKGFFYFYKPSTANLPELTSTSSSSCALATPSSPIGPASPSSTSESAPSFPPSSLSQRGTSSPPSLTSPALGALRFRVLPLPLTDPRAMHESYDLPSPYGPLAGAWEVPVLVLRERGGGLVGGGAQAIRGPLAGFWRLLFKRPLSGRQDGGNGATTPLLTPHDARTLDALLPSFLPRIGPHTKVLRSVLDPFVLDLSANELSVVVLSSASSSGVSSPPSQRQGEDAAAGPRSHEETQGEIAYARFENLFTSLSWTHHRGPFAYGFPADIPVSQRFWEDRPALGTLGWKRSVKSPWKGKVLARFELVPPPKHKSVHAHPQLAIRILKYLERPPLVVDEAGGKKKTRAKVREQQEGKLLCRWKPQGRRLVPWHPQRVKHPFPAHVMQVLKERYWRDEGAQENSEKSGGGILERSLKCGSARG